MKKEERKERAKQEKEEAERQQQREMEQGNVLSEKEQLRIRLEEMEEGNVDRPETKCENTGQHEPVAEEEGGEQEV